MEVDPSDYSRVFITTNVDEIWKFEVTTHPDGEFIWAKINGYSSGFYFQVLPNDEIFTYGVDPDGAYFVKLSKQIINISPSLISIIKSFIFLMWETRNFAF